MFHSEPDLEHPRQHTSLAPASIAQSTHPSRRHLELHRVNKTNNKSTIPTDLKNTVKMATADPFDSAL